MDMADLKQKFSRNRMALVAYLHLGLLAGLGLGLVGPVAAQAQNVTQGRPDSLKMTCDGVRTMVSSRGALVVGSGPDIYDRYVATRAFCLPDEITDPAWLPTSDQRQCFIGYRCKRVDYDFER